MRVTSVFPTKCYTIILEFDHQEYRLLNMKKFLKHDVGKLAEIRDDLTLFRTAKVDEISGTVVFDNGIDFDPNLLFKESHNIDYVIEKSNRWVDTGLEVEYKGAALVLVQTLAYNLVVEERIPVNVVAGAMAVHRDTVEKWVKEWKPL